MALLTSDFFIFGQGNRRKLLYKHGELVDFLTGVPLLKEEVREEEIVDDEYSVVIQTKRGEDIIIVEDESGITVKRNSQTLRLDDNPVKLPTFENHTYSRLLRILHHEILINIVDGQPLPNFMVYGSPWYRDAAMMAMVLEITDNTFLLHQWISNVDDPFDRNNGGHEEPDNLGQLLYLLSLIDTPTAHPLIPHILDEAKRITQNGHLTGITDGRQHPVYQTKWMKFGLRRLGLYDDYIVPDVSDSYAGLCWWDKEGIRLPTGGLLADNQFYPYLTWAEAHFLNAPPPMYLAGKSFPLTWETRASQADYSGMQCVDPIYVTNRTCKPHTWHAAEMFLYLYALIS